LGYDTYVFSGTNDLGADTLVEPLAHGFDAVDFSELSYGEGVTYLHDSTTYVSSSSSGESLSLNVGGVALERVIGTDYSDSFRVDESSLSLEGGLGDDIYQFVIAPSDNGTDGIVEGAGGGVDTYDFSELSDAVFADLRPTPNIENIVGTAFNDTLIGNAGDNVITGLAGEDYIEGREGIDHLIGGDDTDTYFVIDGETLNVTDIIIDEAPSIILPVNPNTSAIPSIELVNGGSSVFTSGDEPIVIATVSDPDTPIEGLTVTITGIDGDDVSVNENGEVVWTPDVEEEGTTYQVVVTVSDGVNSVSTEFSAVVEEPIDTDGDGLSDREEVELGTDPNSFDSDGDLLGDGFEAGSDNLDPLAPNDPEVDSDGDGLSDLDEQINNTDPDSTDTDGDGTNDSDEVDQGSDPTDASDNGEAPDEDDVVDIDLTVGDPSGSRSERYDFQVGRFNHQAPEFGVVTTDTYTFEIGETYTGTIFHRGTDPDNSYLDSGSPNYDWTASIALAAGENQLIFVDDRQEEVEPGTIVYDVNGNQIDISVFPEQILREHIWNVLGGQFLAAGKQVFLHIPEVDLDIIGHDGEEIDDEDETDPGAVVAVNKNDDDEDGEVDLNDDNIEGGDDSFVELILRKVSDDIPEDVGGTTKITFDASKVRVYKDREKTEEVESGVTEFAIDQDHPLFVEAIKASEDLRDIEITAAYTPGTLPEHVTQQGSKAEDTVKLTAYEVELERRDGSGGWEDAGDFVPLYKPLPLVRLPDINQTDLAGVDEYSIPKDQFNVFDTITWAVEAAVSIDGGAWSSIAIGATGDASEPAPLGESYQSELDADYRLTGLNALRAEDLGTRRRYLFRGTNAFGYTAYEELILEVRLDTSTGQHVLFPINLGTEATESAPEIPDNQKLRFSVSPQNLDELEDFDPESITFEFTNDFWFLEEAEGGANPTGKKAKELTFTELTKLTGGDTDDSQFVFIDALEGVHSAHLPETVRYPFFAADLEDEATLEIVANKELFAKGVYFDLDSGFGRNSQAKSAVRLG